MTTKIKVQALNLLEERPATNKMFSLTMRRPEMPEGKQNDESDQKIFNFCTRKVCPHAL